MDENITITLTLNQVNRLETFKEVIDNYCNGRDCHNCIFYGEDYSRKCKCKATIINALTNKATAEKKLTN